MTGGMDYGYVSPWLSLLTLSLIIINLLLVSLAWWNFKETRRLIQEAGKVIQNFLTGEAAMKIATALEKDREADKVRAEFLGHTHDEHKKVKLSTLSGS